MPFDDGRRLIEPAVLGASSCAALVARVFTHPLDTIRLRIQTHSGKSLPPLRELIPKPPSRLYNGLPVALAFSIPALSAYLTTYEAAKRLWAPILMNVNKEHATIWEQFPTYMASGLTAEVISGWLWTPMEVAKSRLQKGNDGNSAARLLRKVWREEGPRGVWRGYTVSICVFGPYTNILAPLRTRQSNIRTRVRPRRGTRKPAADSTTVLDPISSTSLTSRYALSAASACAVSATLTHPIAVIQSMVQTSGGKVVGGVKGDGGVKVGQEVAKRGGHVREVAKAMWRDGGWRPFTRGMGARMVYMIPSNIISMSTYEYCKTYFGL